MHMMAIDVQRQKLTRPKKGPVCRILSFCQGTLTFIPKNPLKVEKGRNVTVIMVRAFIIEFRLF
jgi:hypothetical protein